MDSTEQVRVTEAATAERPGVQRPVAELIQGLPPDPIPLNAPRLDETENAS
jgi:hypothetical protein